jgi:hypothetical protein
MNVLGPLSEPQGELFPLSLDTDTRPLDPREACNTPSQRSVRRWLLLATAAMGLAALLPGKAHAAPAPPVNACTTLLCGGKSGLRWAMSNTLAWNMRRRGATEEEIAATLNQGYLGLVWDYNKNWLELLWEINAANQAGLALGRLFEWLREDDGRFGYKGGYTNPTGRWDDKTQAPCTEFKVEFDAEGNFVLPSLVIAGGMPVKREWPQIPDMVAQVYGKDYAARGSHSAALYWFHRINMAERSFLGDQRAYFGIHSWDNVAGTTGFTYGAASVAYRDQSGKLIPSARRNLAATTQTNWFVASNRVDCPANDGNSPDFDFYVSSVPGSFDNADQFTECTWYLKNYNLGPTGYAYNPQTAIPVKDMAQWLATNEYMGACRISGEFIAKVADFIYRKTAEKPGYTGYPYSPVLKSDVRTGGVAPKGRDLAEPVLPLPPQTPDMAAPPIDPGPAPPPPPPPGQTSTPGAGSPVQVTNWGTPPATNPNVPEGESWSLPDLSSFTWWPSLPTITISTSAECPTYQFEAWDKTFVLESHCPFVEQIRAVVSLIMVAMFALMAVRIVLGA